MNLATMTVFTQVPVLTQSEINPNTGIRVLNQQEVILNQLKNVITNDAMSRSAFIRQFTDPRRNINYECGYPESTSYAGEQYQELFDRFHIANRVVSLMPSESWQVQPKVYEDESASNVTEFEQAWDDLGKQLRADSFYQDEEGSPIWNYLKRLNIVSGIGTFGVMLLGIDDGKRLDQPVDGVEQNYPTSSTSYDIYGPSPTATIAEQPVSTLGTDAQYQPITMSPPVEGSKKGPRKLLFLRVFSEKLLQVTQYESNVNSPRFGQPKMYRVTLNDPKTQSTGIGLPTTTVAVHWTRLIHVADNLINSEVFGNPRMLPVLNQLLDLRKVYAAASEGYWKQAFATMVIKSLPQLGGDPSLDLSAARNTIENIENGLSRSMVLNGFDASTLPPQVTDPTPYITNGLEAICIQLGVPVRVFKGSERGELASSQDDASWNDRLRAYQRDYITPHIIVKFIDRMIAIGVLPEPSGYSIEWPDLDSLTDKDKATIALTQTQAMGAYVGQGVENLIDPMNYFTKILGMTEEVAQAILDDAVKHQEEQMEQDQALADEHGFQPTPPPGYKNPEPEQPAAEPTPLTVKPGEQLIHPQTGQTIAKGPPIPPKPAANSNDSWLFATNEDEVIDLVPVDNTFCATGEGGGVDPSCSSESSLWKESDVQRVVSTLPNYQPRPDSRGGTLHFARYRLPGGGKLEVDYSSRKKDIHIDWVGEKDGTDSMSGKVGMDNLKLIAKVLKKDFPEAETVSGYRMGGRKKDKPGGVMVPLDRFVQNLSIIFNQLK
jgi:hypothetical protein